MERIADQTRFEEEQRAARAAEKGCPDGDGGDPCADSGSRKPKGLVWEVSMPIYYPVLDAPSFFTHLPCALFFSFSQPFAGESFVYPILV